MPVILNENIILYKFIDLISLIDKWRFIRCEYFDYHLLIIRYFNADKRNKFNIINI